MLTVCCDVCADALSRLMSAAVTSARMKKHGVAALFGVHAGQEKAEAPAVSCGVCSAVPGRRTAPAVAKCAHCERSVGECCRRECESCSGVFCSQCATLKYVELLVWMREDKELIGCVRAAVTRSLTGCSACRATTRWRTHDGQASFLDG